MLEIFKNDEIGMIGVAGAKTIPTNGVWWESNHKYGQVYESHTGKMEILAFNEVKSNYEEVKVIDGLIMATQYDISWREDVFDGWHFYDISQSVEMNKKQYKVVVPKQEIPWCIHDCGFVDIKENYEKYRKVFLEEYSKEIFPLVSILIPAYNKPNYLKIGLENVLNQTYKNIEIIICDDSTNDEVENMLKYYLNKFNNIKYRRNSKEKQDIFFKEDKDELRNKEGNNNAIKNFNRCLRLSSGEYINYLMDDDIFNKEKIGKMINYYLEYDDIKLVTSYRQIIDEKGNVLNDILPTKRLSEKDTILEGIILRSFILESMMNSIGEPTCVLFNKKDLENRMFGEFDEKLYYCNVDIATWLGLLSKGKAVYIAEPLSYMRMHNDMRSKKMSVMVLGAIEWFNIIMSSLKYNFYQKDNLSNMMVNWFEKSKYLLDLLKNNNYKDLPLEELYRCFDDASQYTMKLK